MLELEKKWLLKGLPDDIDKFNFTIKDNLLIEQHYLTENTRIRDIRSVMTGERTYKYFEKTRIGEGSCVENEKILTIEEYAAHLGRCKRGLTKLRTIFLDEDTGYTYEFDYIDYTLATDYRMPILLLEIEFQDRYKTMQEVNANFKLPEFVQKHVLLDVTDMKQFSNYALSEDC